jgi:predicted metal-dependent hydrolase
MSAIPPLRYLLRRSARSRRLSVRVEGDGRVIVTVPARASDRVIERFVADQAPWIRAAVAKMLARPQGAPLSATAADRTRLMAATRKLVGERLHFWNATYGFRIGEIKVRDQKTRWGSCAKNHNLTFNYRLAMLPFELADYVVVHELCHIGQFDHSAKFWALVARSLPNAKALRKRLNADWKIT